MIPARGNRYVFLSLYVGRSIFVGPVGYLTTLLVSGWWHCSRSSRLDVLKVVRPIADLTYLLTGLSTYIRYSRHVVKRKERKAEKRGPKTGIIRWTSWKLHYYHYPRVFHAQAKFHTVFQPLLLPLIARSVVSSSTLFYFSASPVPLEKKSVDALLPLSLLVRMKWRHYGH